MQFRSMRQKEYVNYTGLELSIYAMELPQIISMWSERMVYTEFCDRNYGSLILVAVEDNPLPGKPDIVRGVAFTSVLDGWLYIRSLYVEPEMTGRKIGSALMTASILLQMQRFYLVGLRLEVFTGNLPAVGLYGSFGMTDKPFEYPEEFGGTAKHAVPPRFRISSMENRISPDFMEIMTRRIQTPVSEMLPESCREFIASGNFEKIREAVAAKHYIPSWFNEHILKPRPERDENRTEFDDWCDFQDWIEAMETTDEPDGKN